MKLSDRTFVNVNAAFTLQFGYNEVELIGRRPEELNLWARRDARQTFEKNIVETGKVVSLETCMTCRNKNELDCIVSAETLTISENRCILAPFLTSPSASVPSVS